ncbi:uncharacterized protein AB675_11960 [Cyphellophora attinorum]|uniref:Heterokaryon incompatibility domain-containing protein n=1 Tax=Cyphellophora attinorum TaxID=1664694 RepID=A0A0N1H8L4_9EURO|nr:uncharacterized protein AB675_11960 [Phialophora attinorum]KPI38290.1 hypothetical protein AB675_11960 [Phialophora attinorum]
MPNSESRTDTQFATTASGDDGLYHNHSFSDNEGSAVEGKSSHDDEMYSEVSTDSEESSSMTITVNGFRWCHCQIAGYDVDHLALQQTETSLHSAHAAALSYAIGDFGRTLHVLGHVHHDAPRPFRLTFGAEWDIEDTKAALVHLTNVNGGIWLDQLSITQEPAEIALFLPRLPQIYSILEVVVLLPNAPCSCLQSAVDSYLNGSDDFRDGDGNFHTVRVMDSCYNALPISSYHSRFWTMVEFKYARSIRAYFVSVAGPCGAKTSRYIQHKLCEIRSLGDEHELVDISDEKWLEWHLDSSLASFEGGVAMCIGSGSIALLRTAQFFLGTPLHRKYRLKVLGPPLYSTNHRATVVSDMVSVVFASDRRYKPPADSSHLNLSALLEDGLRQRERNYCLQYLTTIPQGLLVPVNEMNTRNTTLCRPTMYINIVKVSTAIDLYGTLLANQPLQAGGYILMKSRRADHGLNTRMHNIAPFHRFLAERSIFGVVEAFATMQARHSYLDLFSLRAKYKNRPLGLLDDWARKVARGDLEDPAGKWPTLDHQRAVFVEVCRYFYMKNEHTPYASTEGFSSIDVHEVCFDITCDALGIDRDVAHKYEFGLVVHSGPAVVLGFFNAEACAALCDADETMSGAVEGPRSSHSRLRNRDHMTVSVLDHASEHGNITYETQQLGNVALETGREVPAYGVIGVWAMGLIDDPAIGADLTDIIAECDAVLV